MTGFAEALLNRTDNEIAGATCRDCKVGRLCKSLARRRTASQSRQDFFRTFQRKKAKKWARPRPAGVIKLLTNLKKRGGARELVRREKWRQKFCGPSGVDCVSCGTEPLFSRDHRTEREKKVSWVCGGARIAPRLLSIGRAARLLHPIKSAFNTLRTRAKASERGLIKLRTNSIG